MQTQSSNGMPHRYVSPLEVHAMKHDPNYQPKSEEFMIRSILGEHDRSRLDELWKIHVEHANAIVAQLEGQPLKAAKPEPGDPSVVFYDIPDSGHLAVRRWNGGLEEDRAYCFDVYDTSIKVPINLPAAFKFLKLPSSADIIATNSVEAEKIISWEETWGLRRKDIRAGCERFIAREGSHLALTHPEKPTFFSPFQNALPFIKVFLLFSLQAGVAKVLVLL